MQTIKILLVIVILLATKMIVAQCPTLNSSYNFNSQEQLDLFLDNYPNCTKISNANRVSIHLNSNVNGTPIHDLTPLSQLTEINSSLEIIGNVWIPNQTHLTSLDGLHNLQKLKRLFILNVNTINDLNEICAIDSIESLSLFGTSIQEFGCTNLLVTKELILSNLNNIQPLQEIQTRDNLETLWISQCEKLNISTKLDQVSVAKKFIHRR